MANKLVRAYHLLLDKYMGKDGFVTEEDCIWVFGGIPKFQHCGLVGIDCTSIFSPTRKYVQLGPFKKTYEKIVQAGENGAKELTLSKDDFLGHSSLFYLSELTELQKKAEESGIRSVLRDIKLHFDYASLGL